MAANQSAKPSVFLPLFQATVATALGIPTDYVRLVARPDPDKWSYMVGDVAAAIYLNPNNDKSDAGAGRYGTPVSQEMQVIIRSDNLQSQAGGNESIIGDHFDRELAVANAIHLIHVGNPAIFIMPPRLVPGGESITRNEQLVGMIESVIRFRLDYVLAVNIP